jgi:predicted nucleotidyltransferase
MWTRFTLLFHRLKVPGSDLALGEMPWISPDLAERLAVGVALLRQAFGPGVRRIGLYGSWQRGNATSASDVDLVVFLTHDVEWFDSQYGILDRTGARKDQMLWKEIERKVNQRVGGERVFSIAVVTPAMLAYYPAHGPVHLQNWAMAMIDSISLWESG